MLIFLTFIDSDEDKSKFVKIYENYHKLVQKIASGYFQSKPDIEDATQSVFFRIANNIEKIKIDDTNRLTCFISTIAKNTCVEILRKRNREVKTVSLSPLEELLAAEEESAEDRILLGEIANYILSMNSRYRYVLYLYFYVNMSVATIAATLGIKPETVRTRIKRGTRMLREKFGEDRNG